MKIKAGEEAKDSGEFVCEECHKPMAVMKGQMVSKCAHCGNSTFVKKEAFAGTERGKK